MIKLNITTPEKTLLETEAESVTLPTQLGEITILPGHIPLVANLEPGEIRYRQGGANKFFAVSSGVLQITQPGNHVVVLADTAEAGHEIDEKRAEEARLRAQKLMSESYADEKARTSAAASLEKHLARLRVAKKHRTHTHRNLESGTMNQ